MEKDTLPIRRIPNKVLRRGVSQSRYSHPGYPRGRMTERPEVSADGFRVFSVAPELDKASNGTTFTSVQETAGSL